MTIKGYECMSCGKLTPIKNIIIKKDVVPPKNGTHFDIIKVEHEDDCDGSKEMTKIVLEEGEVNENRRATT